ncbi:EAL domain-containing protein [Deinococcus deserti]|uniref:Putative diguanylate cyclase/phosphodiesterase putative membrane protein n=2 Tax=Deinococcus TaxID=1298 RepID=C1CX76_DEIDV|nr:EAL domain-containing protein [Deinococcus deserti]ACO46793.2 putative diguanylate cyclase/phosphodiesterase; putative membrane protein [Deinococcus deserti VCD115]
MSHIVAWHLPAGLRSLLPLRFERRLVLLLIGIACAHLAFVLLPYRSDETREWAGNLFFIPPFVISAVLALRVAARHPAQRASWLWFGTGQLGWATGQIIYAYLDLMGTSPYPSAADAFFLALIPCFITGLLLFNRSPVPRKQRLILALDTLIIVFALAGAYWEVAIGRSIESHQGSTFALAVGLAYPTADLVLIALLTVFCVWRPREFAAPNTLALTVGLLSLLMADAGYQIKTAAESYQVGFGLDLFWTSAATLFGVAAALTGAPLTRGRIRWERVTQNWLRAADFAQVALPYLAIAMALSLAILHYLFPDHEAGGVILMAFVVVTLSSGRQFLTQQEARQLQRDLDLQAKHDPLTGLVNRGHLVQLLDYAIERADSRYGVAVLFIDLDRFKSVNDIYGHTAGDNLLRNVAQRLQNEVRRNDIVARQGGDEFVVVATGVLHASAVHDLGRRLLQALSRPYTVGTESVTLSASIGVTLCPAESVDASEALRNADIAMYEAKRRGRNSVQFYNQHIEKQTSEIHRIEVQLRGAIERGELRVVYQPLVSLDSRQVRSAEALLRWDSPVLGPVSPAVFIPVAEQRGLIHAIGSWVLDTAMGQLSVWRATGHPDLSVSVNVSPLQFERDDFIAQVRAALDRHHLPGSALTLELTEGSLLTDFDASNIKLRQLRALGIQVALDDFGTGYSSLAYLRTLHVDIVKIDRSFIWAIQDDGLTFVEAIVRIAHHLKLRIVAEGIETLEQCSSLQHLSCDLGQGYLFAKPLAADRFAAFAAQAGCPTVPEAST